LVCSVREITGGKVQGKESALMATTGTTLDRPVERSGLSEQRVAKMAGNSAGKSDITTAASQDAADILSILDGFGAQQPSTDQLPQDAPLTAEEQEKLARLLGNTNPKIETKLKIEAKPAFDKQEQVRLDDLPAKAKSQSETVATEHDSIARELTVAGTRVKELEKNVYYNEANEQDRTRGGKEITHLRSELTEITKGHDSLVAQVQKLLGLLEDSNANREALEADLSQSHKTIDSLQKEVRLLQGKLADHNSMVSMATESRAQLVDKTTKLRAQLVEQTVKITTNHEKYQREITQRMKAEKMLGEIKSRLALLTQSKSACLQRRQ